MVVAPSASMVTSPADMGGQISLMDMADNPIITRLKELDVNVLTPIEAMQVLYELIKEASTY